MLSQGSNIASKQASKDEGQSSGGGGSGGGRKTSSMRPPEQTLKCPRCDSPNTKFCYYNNYSLTQPRYFCKACRRYWTKGGALRNVPIGGGCRKNKKTKSCSPRFFVGESSSKDSPSNVGGMKFYGLPAVDFQLGGLNFPPRVTATNQFSSSYGEASSNPSFVNFDPLGFHFPFSSSHMAMSSQGDQQQQHNQSGGGLANFHEMPTSINLHHNTDLASSIESLSSINQDLHWKLQQQRFAMLFGGGGSGSGSGSVGSGENDQQQQQKLPLESHAQKLQPILFQNLEISKPTQSSMDGEPRKDSGNNGGGGGGGLATEWFFDNNYAAVNLNPATPTNSNNAGNDQNRNINWNGNIQAWNHFNQYSAIP